MIFQFISLNRSILSNREFSNKCKLTAILYYRIFTGAIIYDSIVLSVSEYRHTTFPPIITKEEGPLYTLVLPITIGINSYFILLDSTYAYSFNVCGCERYSTYNM